MPRTRPTSEADLDAIVRRFRDYEAEHYPNTCPEADAPEAVEGPWFAAVLCLLVIAGAAIAALIQYAS